MKPSPLTTSSTGRPAAADASITPASAAKDADTVPETGRPSARTPLQYQQVYPEPNLRLTLLEILVGRARPPRIRRDFGQGNLVLVQEGLKGRRRSRRRGFPGR